MPIVTFDPDADGSDQDAASGVHARDCDCPQCAAEQRRALAEQREGIADSYADQYAHEEEESID